MRSMWLGLGSAAFAILVCTAPASAGVVRCEDVNRELGWGYSASEVAESLGTTRTRIAACAHLAAEVERHGRHRAELLARQAARRASN